ncbi:MAG: LysM peptidoglycan-binding domain-containing protein [Lachnospiraceae bacterium]|nr:LysM peptidoglycan-binding domain-containing protein [Lachnospiraceae bacterium]
MKSIKRGIAVLLAALLIVPNMLAKAEVDAPAASQGTEVVQYNTGDGIHTIVIPVAQPEKTEPESISGNSVSGGDATGGTERDTTGEIVHLSPSGDDCFAADGSYTIRIPETDPFFPYEVQFSWDGVVSNRWFMTPDDTVEIGGHTFRVAADFTGTAMTQMSLDIAGRKVIVYPESKNFSGEDNVEDIPQAYSLLPLEYRALQVDLTGFTPAELTMVSVDSIFTGENALTDTSQIMWAAYSNDDYIISGAGDSLNLSAASYWEMIVGVADQLAADNIRYRIDISTTNSYDWLVPTVYIQAEDGSRAEVTVNDCYYYSTYSDERVSGYLRFDLLEKEMQERREAYVSLNIDVSSFANTNYDHMRVFEGTHKTAAEAEAAAEITDRIWQADMSQINAGYLTSQYADHYVTLVMYNASNEVIGLLPIYIYWSLDRSYVSASSLYYGQSYNEYFYSYSSTTGSDGVVKRIFNIPSGYAVNGSYRLPMYYYQDGTSNKDAVTAAYVGLYSSIAEATTAGAVDIKDTVFGNGYVADYSQGVCFSIFVGADGAEDQEIYRFYFITQEDPTASASSNNLHSGTAVQFNGLVDGDGNSVDCYVMSYNEDSYAEYNFPTILVDSDVDVTNLAPRFSTSTGVNLYAPGSSSPEVSGKSYHNFANGPVQYTAAAENGEDSMNYWLQIVKPSQGAGQLYVNSLADPDAQTNGINSKREVMLDGYHDNVHDIVLINMGTEAISALTAEVVSDVVELDAYWTLKGVYDLAGFSGTDRTNSYGELANMAKVRLRVKEGVSNGADISGTLTIKSNGTPLMVMTLTGTIGNPCISTTKIPEAVKYVPYGSMIQNNNKYSWNTVSYSLYYGSLPQGMVIKSNGELYGAPRETGEFTFAVYMTNSASQFSNLWKEFTLIVKENTDTNVDGATDVGYDVTQRIPTLQLGNVSSDQLFVSQGVFDQFAGCVFLDGQLLEAGKDYRAESGSTRITILSQTLNNDLGEGTHTLGVEFRTPDTGTLKRAAQNFVLSTSPVNSGNNNIGNGNNGEKPPAENSPGNSGNNSNNGKGDITSIEPIKNIVYAGNVTEVAYTIVSGDTLWKIADRFYGNGTLWTKIFADNADIIKDANKIYVGQVIRLYIMDQPEQASISAVPTTTSIPLGNTGQLPIDAEAGEVYVVQTGDSLWKIAAKLYGDGHKWRSIYAANQDVLRAPGKIYAGQRLIIPDK